MADRWKLPLTSISYWDSEWVELTFTPPYAFMTWEADHSPPYIVLRFRMPAVWHSLRHKSSWREKLTTHLHVVLRFRMSGVWHALRHTPSCCAQEKRLLPSPVTERSMLVGILVATAAVLQRISLWEQRSSQRLFPAEIWAVSRCLLWNKATYVIYIENEELLSIGVAFDILFISSLLGAGKANNIAAEKWLQHCASFL